MVEKLSVAITGATSATGLWIARSFSSQKWKVFGLCSQAESSYSGIKAERLAWLKSVSEISYSLRAEESGIIQWIKDHHPSIWVHHHHLVENYKNENYDYERSVRECFTPLKNIVGALKENNVQGIISTGTYFLASESLYGKSKAETAKALRAHTKDFQIPFTEIVVPDPVGPFENEDRFIPQLIKCSKEKKRFALTAPTEIADHLPMDSLADLYLTAAHDLLKNKERTIRPSGLVCNFEEWTKIVETRLLQRLDLKSEIDFINLNNQTEIRSHLNDDKIKIDWMRFFLNYANFIKTRTPWRNS